MDDMNSFGDDSIFSAVDDYSDSIIDTSSYMDDYSSDTSSVHWSSSQSFDSNGDGINDITYEYGYDENGHAINIHSYDMDVDGIPDKMNVFSDADGDGKFDHVTKIYFDSEDNLHYQSAGDIDGDGLPDWNDKGVIGSDELANDSLNWDSNFTDDLKWNEDFNNDLNWDSDSNYSLDWQFVQEPEDFNFEFLIEPLDIDVDSILVDYDYNGSLPEGIYDGFVPGGDLENFDTVHLNSEIIVGDPVESMEHWEFQGNTNRCALYSQKFVLEELTGREYSIEDIASLAREKGWFTEDNGTPLLNMDKILKYNNIETELTFHNDLKDIEKHLNSGHKLICTVDSDEIWFGKDNNDLFSPNSSTDHAVQIIGIDYSSPVEPMVILNDSGTPDGKGEMVPWSVFSDAWDDGDRDLIVAKI